jgi:hypothetical protein
MKTQHLKLIVCLMLTMITFRITAQDAGSATNEISLIIPNLALIDLEGATSGVSLTPTVPTEAGEALSFADITHSGIYLNYSSILPVNLTSRSIQAKVSGTIPAGIDFKVSAAAAMGAGGGTRGTPATALTLSATDQALITGITSAFTGDGNQGHEITYSISLTNASDYNLLRANGSGTPITVTYTMADN